MHAGDYEADRREFEELAMAAGADIVDVIGGSRRQPDPALFVGSGKAEEIAEVATAREVELVIFNHSLSPAQERNLERLLHCRVLDRAGLILDIFAQRARSHEGKLQVELAQLQHLASRLVRGWTHLERQKGGIGLRGPGETQLETDRRLVRDRIATLRGQIEDVRARRARTRQARRRNQVPAVSLVGYTNAGKSSLFNALTGDATFASQQLFATLDTTVRQWALPQGEPITLSDTVGFIRDLPHELIAAFRATLEESRQADLLLHVVDSADAERAARQRQVEQVLHEVGAGEVPALLVFNKIDLRPEAEVARIDRDEHGRPWRVHVSARSGAGLDLLNAAVAELLRPVLDEVELQIPPSAFRLRAQLFERKAVRSEQCNDDGSYLLRVCMPYQRLRGLCEAAGVTPPAGPAAEDWESAPPAQPDT